MSSPTVTPDPNAASPSSNLGNIVSQPTPNYPPSPDQGGPVPSPQASPAPVGSRLLNIMKGVVQAASVGLQGIPESRRPSYVSGLGSGARAQQAAKAYGDEIKFRDMDTQIRLANLHRQDLAQQQQTEEQQAAQQAAQDFQKKAFDDPENLTYVPHPNDGTTVTTTLKAQTAANGFASVAPGTHLNADGSTINVPSNTPQTLAAQVKKYQALQGVIPFLDTLPAFDPSTVKSTQDVVNARNDLGKHIDQMTHILEGHKPDGGAFSHADLNNLIPSLQAQRDAMANSGNATPYQLGTLDNLIKIYQANEKNHTDTEAKAASIAAQQAGDKSQAEEQGKVAAQTTPEAIAAQAKLAGEKAKAEFPYKAALQDNAAGNKNSGKGDWVPGATADEKKKAELAENMVFNANNIAAILQRRPDIVGKVSGRITNVEQMAGTNDPDIVQLGIDIHNIAMANNGIHGLRSAEAVKDFERGLLNNFKNGPRGIAGGLMGSVGSVQTFIDNARPDTYKTHSKNGGAIKVMVPNQ